jgi:hypothetical protein
MFRLELSRKEINSIYAVIIVADLFFVIMTSPVLSSPVLDGERIHLNSLADFIKYQLDLKYEKNVATWYSSCLLFLTGIGALLNSKISSSAPGSKRINQGCWLLVGLVLIGLSIDETATLHETLVPLLNFLNKDTPSLKVRVGAGDWIPLLLPLIVITAVGMGSFFWLTFRLQRRVLAFGIEGVLCWVGVILTEAIEGKILAINLSRQIEGVIEEGLEIMGTTLMLIAFIEFYCLTQDKLSKSTPELTVVE